MGVSSFFGSGGIFHNGLLFMLKLGWRTRVRVYVYVPLVIVMSLLALDLTLWVDFANEFEHNTNHLSDESRRMSDA